MREVLYAGVIIMEQKNYKLLLIEELAEAGNKKAMLEMARHYSDRKNEKMVVCTVVLK